VVKQNGSFTTALLTPAPWHDYELIDSGDGRKFERFGAYYLVRPESQAIWEPALPASEWQRADAVFERDGGGEIGPGTWKERQSLPTQWLLRHNTLSFWARLTPFRHTGVFPEHMAHWPWLEHSLRRGRQPNALILFGYTGLVSLYAASLGARVVHVDASKPATQWAQANQAASGLTERPIRWIVDDVLKFVRREERRGTRYDVIVMDPPIFGRGPKGEIWRFAEAFPELLTQCLRVLSDAPSALLVNAYATNFSPLALGNVLAAAMRPFGGAIEAGDLALNETASQRLLPAAIYARWSS
jgi:23S rRNA (cytosine1962-C5)-methyltransferase